MGVHHAWGRTLKDVWQRYHAMLGCDQRYQNGFDCQGLWVEVEVEKALGLNSKPEIESYGLDRFARACRDRVAEYAGVQTSQSQRLGQWMDWDRSYFTMSDANISYIWGFLKECHDRGWLYKGHRSMPWCPRCGTSLSQHELIDSYREIGHPSLYVRLPLTGRPGEYLVCGRPLPGRCPPTSPPPSDPDADYARSRRPRASPTSPRAGSSRCRCRGGCWARCRARSWSGSPTRARSTRCRPSQASSTGWWLGRGVDGRGHRHRPHRARLRRRGLRAGYSGRGWRRSCRSTSRAPSTTASAGCTAAHRRCRPADRRGSRPARPAGRGRRDHPPLPGLLALRHRADLPAGGRVVHPLRRGARADDRGRPQGRVDAAPVRQADGGLAAQHGRLVHQPQALLGPAAAVLLLRRTAT